MAEVLVLVEHAEGALKKVTSELITAARALGEPAAVVVGAPGTAAPLIDGLKEAGAAKIYVAESDEAEKYLGGVEVAVPLNTYWPLYWVLASVLIEAMIWPTSCPRSAMSLGLIVPLPASVTSSWVRCTWCWIEFSAEVAV